MKALFFLLVLISVGPLKADVVVIPYTVEFRSSFLLGHDSLNVIIQTGREIRRVKLIEGEKNRFKFTYFIPCFSGRSLSSKEKEVEILSWNGRTINLYYEESKEMISIPHITENIFVERINSDSIYRLALDRVEPSSEDLSAFKSRYYKFIAIEAQLQFKGLESLLKVPGFADKFSANYLSVIKLEHFTATEVSTLFKVNLPHSGNLVFDRYLDGSEKGNVLINTKNGYVHYITFGR